MSNITIHTAIDTSLSSKTDNVFSTLGVSINDTPNKETIAAMEDARNGKVEHYSSLNEMWADLDNKTLL